MTGPRSLPEYEIADHERSGFTPTKPEPGESLGVKLFGAQRITAEQARSAVTDPLIRELVARLPKPNAVWSTDDRIKWLRAAVSVFNLVYQATDGDRKEIDIRHTEDGA